MPTSLLSLLSNEAEFSPCGHVVVSIYKSSPITAEQCRTKATIFITHVDPISAPYLVQLKSRKTLGREWWSRRVPPPGPYRLFHSAFIVIAGLLRHLYI